MSLPHKALPDQEVRRNFEALDRRLDGIGSLPAARVYNSADIAITTATFTALTFDSERFDTGTIHDTSTNTGRLTATTAGVYLITGHLRFANNATGMRHMEIMLNDTTVIAPHREAAVPGGHTTEMSVSTIYKMAATDWVTLRVYQDSTISLNVVAAANSSPEFAMAWLGNG